MSCRLPVFWQTIWHEGHARVTHDDVIKWKHFPRYWPFVRGIHRSPGEFPAQRPVTRSFDFSLISTRINDWLNNGEAGDLRRYRAHYDVTVVGLSQISEQQCGESMLKLVISSGNWRHQTWDKCYHYCSDKCSQGTDIFMQFADKYKNNDSVGNEDDDNNDDIDDDDNDNDDNDIHIIINDILILMIMTIKIIILMTTKINKLLILIMMIIITFRLPILVVSTRIHGTGIDEKHFFCHLSV